MPRRCPHAVIRSPPAVFAYAVPKSEETLAVEEGKGALTHKRSMRLACATLLFTREISDRRNILSFSVISTCCVRKQIELIALVEYYLPPPK